MRFVLKMFIANAAIATADQKNMAIEQNSVKCKLVYYN